MGQRCSAAACAGACFEALGLLGAPGSSASTAGATPARQRPVGLERRHTRRLRSLRAAQAAQVGEANNVEKCRQQRHLEQWPLRSLFEDPSVDGQTYCWEGTLRVGAKVSPACRSFDSEYKLLDTVLGSGMNGTIVLARRRGFFHAGDASAPAAPEEGLVAVKKLDKKGLSEAELMRVLMEVDIYLKMDHVSICKLLRVFNEEDQVYLVMEYCSGGALCDCLLKAGRYSDERAADAVRQVLSAVNYCHCHPEGKVCHRDLKHSNFLYASKEEGAPLKLVDFGLSRVLSANRPQMSTCAGTLYYMAPEVVTGQRYNESCDMWSVGVVAYSLLCGQPPFHCSTDKGVAEAISRADLGDMNSQGWAGVSDLAKDFIKQHLQIDPSKRPTAEQALQHPWVTTLRGKTRPNGPQAAVPLSRDVLERVRCFAHESAVRRASAALVVYSRGELYSDLSRDLEAQFRALDVDGNGTISASELVQALETTLGITSREANFIFGQLDIDGDSMIHHSEFLAAAMGAEVLQCHHAVREAFSRFDLDQDGKIELGEWLSVLGPSFCGKPTHEIFRELDKNGDCFVDLDEFAYATCGMVSQDSTATTEAWEVETEATMEAWEGETEPPPSSDATEDGQRR